MKAIVYRRYGSPDVLRLEEVDRPIVKEGDVLVRVHAASVNPLDWHLLRGQPYIVRPTSGWRRPKRNIPGVDVAGVVEAVGRNVTELRPGDEVFGEMTRACAEYVSGPQRLFVHKPANLTLEQAAAIPVGAVTALQALREHGNIQPGQRVLINGASGGVGTFAVQLAKVFEADVTGVCSTPNMQLVRSLGADHVIDYTRENFTRDRQRYDLVIDNVGNHSLLVLRRVLVPTGALVVVGIDPSKGNWIAPIARMLGGQLLSRGSQKIRFMLTDIEREDLLFIKELIEAGRIIPVIDRTYPLSEVPDAIRYLETMRARGKVIITV
ncbi:MAG: NAD(P)-dependent alcohol dehydrogenase [Chloroflexi bacterium]|nr:NAD(P)-dependent alcohol dehydrogenase [Chloroflexota bacterium]